jgi:hypothetical protein
VKVDELIRSTLHEQAAAQQPPRPGLADRVLTARRRRRARTLVLATTATAAVLALAVVVPTLGPDARTEGASLGQKQNDIIAHPDQSPPRDLIAAGNTALAAYSTSTLVKKTRDDGYDRNTYWILDPKTGTYVKDSRWSDVAVAPGMRTAAVLEQSLPARRIGLLDLATGKITRWIPVGKGVGGLAFSPDGSKLVATTYGSNPDEEYRQVAEDGSGKGNTWFPGEGDKRTGFYVVHVTSGARSWSAVKDDPEAINSRQDFAFSADGRLVYSGRTTAPSVQYYDFTGHKAAAPADEKYRTWYVDAGLSPNGTLMAGDFAGSGKTTGSVIVDPRTGKQLYKVPGQQLLAWVDDKRLIAWDIAPGTNEFHNHLVLVTIGSKKTVPLSGFQKGNDGSPGRWTPVFATR